MDISAQMGVVGTMAAIRSWRLPMEAGRGWIGVDGSRVDRMHAVVRLELGCVGPGFKKVTSTSVDPRSRYVEFPISRLKSRDRHSVPCSLTRGRDPRKPGARVRKPQAGDQGREQAQTSCCLCFPLSIPSPGAGTLRVPRYRSCSARENESFETKFRLRSESVHSSFPGPRALGPQYSTSTVQVPYHTQFA